MGESEGSDPLAVIFAVACAQIPDSAFDSMEIEEKAQEP